MVAPDFQQLLLARPVSEYAAAVGSIVIQTALRDSYSAATLARVFSVLGIALAISPALGMMAGQQIAAVAGHRGVFALLGLLALALAIGAGLVLALLPQRAFVIGMAVIAAAYAIAIPNLLADALHRYSGRLGSAGAILSLIYYGLLASALLLAGRVQRLEWVLLFSALLAFAVYRLRPARQAMH